MTRVKTAPIPPHLRPHVRGAVVEEADTRKLESCAPLQILEEILVFASIEDPTARYFLEGCREIGVAAELVAIEGITAKLIQRLASQKNTRCFLRPCDVKSRNLQIVLSRVLDYFALAPGRIVNRPSRSVLNFSKPLQMVEISKNSAGSVSPILTKLSTEPGICQTEASIVKSISSERSRVVFASELRPELVYGRMATPVQLQPFVRGIPIRAHVVGTRVFAVEASASGTDYRYADDLTLTSTVLPSQVEMWCIKAAAHENLIFAGIDLIRASDPDAYFCLEINPTPAYHFFERPNVGSEKPITKALVEYLISGA